MQQRHGQTTGFRWVKCQKVRGQGGLDAWVDRDDCLRAVCLAEEEAGENRDTVKRSERGADVPYLLSFLVRAQVWTVMCMSVDVTSGLQGTQAWVSPDPGGWRGGVKSGDVMGRRAPHGGVAMGWTKKHCELLGLSVCCQTSNYKLFILILCCLYLCGYREIWVSVFDLRCHDVADVECWKLRLILGHLSATCYS